MTNAMPAVSLRERKRLETWRLLKEVALGLVAERGFEAVSVEDIADAAGVSKRTFFNYFASKEAVVFDPDPEEPKRWRALVDERPADESLWVSLGEVWLGYTGHYETKLTVLKQLTASSPTLAQSSKDSGAQFQAFLHSWALERNRVQGGEPLRATLACNAAVSVVGTAFAAWQPQDGFPRFQDLLRAGFAALGTGLLTPPAPT